MKKNLIIWANPYGKITGEVMGGSINLNFKYNFLNFFLRYLWENFDKTAYEELSKRFIVIEAKMDLEWQK